MLFKINAILTGAQRPANGICFGFIRPCKAAQTIPRFGMIDRNQETCLITAKSAEIGAPGQFTHFPRSSQSLDADIIFALNHIKLNSNRSPRRPRRIYGSTASIAAQSVTNSESGSGSSPRRKPRLSRYACVS